MSVEKSEREREPTAANRYSVQTERDDDKGPQIKHVPASYAVFNSHPTLMKFSSLFTMLYNTVASLHSNVTSNFTPSNANTGSVLASLAKRATAARDFCTGFSGRMTSTVGQWISAFTSDNRLTSASTECEACEEKRTSIRQESAESTGPTESNGIPACIAKVVSECKALESSDEKINPELRRGTQIIYRRIELLEFRGANSRGADQEPNDVSSKYANILETFLPAEMQRVMNMAVDAENRANMHSDRSDMDEQQMLSAIRPFLAILASLEDVRAQLSKPHSPNVERVSVLARTLLDKISNASDNRSETVSISTLETATLERTPQSERSERSVWKEAVELLRLAAPAIPELFAQQHTKDNRRDSIWSTQGQIIPGPDSNGQELAPAAFWEVDGKELDTEQFVDTLWKDAEHKSGKSV